MVLFFLILAAWSLSIRTDQPYSRPLYVEFNTSMSQIHLYKESFIHEYHSWHIAKNLYDEHIIECPDYSAQPRIPLVIHQIWLGSELPDVCKKLRDTWLEKHPNWEYILWTDETIEQFGLINKERYDASHNYGEKSDIARYEILYRYGGLYIDTDFECLQSFDDLHHYCDFYAGITCEPELVAFNGLIASKPGHPILKECIITLKTSPSISSDILERTGPFFFTRCIFKSLANYTDKIVLFPTTYFYPWPWYQRFNNTRAEIESWVRKESRAIHHWHVSWMS